ncbi:hypothetical protein Cgig2_014522 [Carnegiea gigantea]|uniref:Uncharacterized protein n=1 Tax=Carnegiea gigantea TaxID=171969 RepID=A0A9Q1KGA1_9CARY|nr:hypothetical protein Cgig2_014522 [Carnegiea gigantea]
MEYDPTRLRTRMSPYGLCSFLPTISDEQKRDIIELGFAFLLTLRVDKIPSRLARWLVENFDTCRLAVKLASNDELRGQQKWKVNHFVLKNLVDLKEVKDLNWCEFTTDSLIPCMDKWKRQPKGIGFRLSQSLQVESPNQGGSRGVGGIGSGSQSSTDSRIQRSPDLGSETSAGDSVRDCLPPRKKMPAPHFRSPFFVRHIDALKF